MKTEEKNNEIEQPVASNAGVSQWHVWEVGYHFFAARSLDDAKRLFSYEWGVDEDDLESWEYQHCDNRGFHRNATGWDDYDEDNPDCTLRERAEEMIEGGESLPFMVAVSLQ